MDSAEAVDEETMRDLVKAIAPELQAEDPDTEQRPADLTSSLVRVRGHKTDSEDEDDALPDETELLDRETQPVIKQEQPTTSRTRSVCLNWTC